MVPGSYIYFNNHPYLLDVGDCVKRSIALVTGMSYNLVSRRLNAHKKVTGVSVFNEHPNPVSYVENVLRFPRVKVSRPADGKKLITLGEFAREHPTGRYILSSKEHWTACIDGVIYDTWDCREDELEEYFEILQYDKTRVERRNCFTLDHAARKYVYFTFYDYEGHKGSARVKKEEVPAFVADHNEHYLNLDLVGEYI